LREGKSTSWEGGDRVPCIMRWPGTLPKGTVCNELAATLDILPTFAGLAGAPLPQKKIDGVNLAPLLKDGKGPSPREHFFYYYPQGGTYFQLQAVTDGRWKLHFPHDYRSYEGVEPGRDGFPGPYTEGRTGLALFDMQGDIAERKDVKDDHPEIVEKMQAWGEMARKTLGDHEIKGTEVRPPGKI
ncbi:MAG: sulfatase-like hydrolase/transferase, partial [Planctomycetes bacterium]|nr:sulfatase-like hydrolase/transferase [Planctomycetota bacterium]